VLPPLNITAPTPVINLKGFHWGTVDEKIHGPQASQGYRTDPPQAGLVEDEQLSTEQAFVVPEVPQFSQRVGEAPPPPGTAALPEQLAKQIGLKDKPKPGPFFPLEQFQGAYAGNGFNMIFRPQPAQPDADNKMPTPVGPGAGRPDNILELNLTLEQISFGASIGDIPNRGLGKQPDIHLSGVPYLQTVQDVTNPDTGKGDNMVKTDIHFEPGVWLNVPAAKFHNGKTSVVRMASIPHGTTVNAQGFVEPRNNKTVLGGAAGRPSFDILDATPFDIKTKDKVTGVFGSMNADNQRAFRIPQNLEKFGDKGTGKITTAIIKNPNLVLQKAIEGLEITETITFEVRTGPGPPTAQLNGGGTANISFLAGEQNPITTAAPTASDQPIAHAATMTSKYWIERVMYKVNIPANLPPKTTVQLRPTMPPNSTAPTPVFSITTPAGGNLTLREITVPGIQIQSSQTVLLNFATLSWPHVSVSTLVPVDPQRFQMT
jgi:hypothetical protein